MTARKKKAAKAQQRRRVAKKAVGRAKEKRRPAKQVADAALD